MKPNKEAQRRALISCLMSMDRNGCYSDEDATCEFGRPWTLEELEQSLAHLEADDV